MKKNNFQFGYTLIEMLVVVTIVGILVGGGIVALSRYGEKQRLKRAGTQLYSDLRLAQAKAQSSERVTDCAAGDLQGYGVEYGADASKYALVVLCRTGNIVLTERQLPLGVETLTSSKCVGSVEFYILAKGAKAGVMCLKRATDYYQLVVTAGGEIADSGFVEENVVLP